MVEDVIRWPSMGEIYSEVLDCLGEALVDLLSGVMDLRLWMLLSVRELERCKGSRGSERPTDSNRSFLLMLTFNIVLAALETLRHMLDFKSSVFCFGFG